MKSRTLLFLIPFLFILQCSTVDLQVNRKVVMTDRSIRVAILPFRIRNANWGSEFADAIGLHLAKNDRFVQVERGSELSRILDEQQFQESGLIDDQARAEIGRLTSAHLIVVGDGQALKLEDINGNPIKNLVDTCTVKAIDVETGNHVITIRKSPGTAWTWAFRLKYLLGLSLIWDRHDILIESSLYDEIANQFARNLESAIDAKKPETERVVQDRNITVDRYTAPGNE